MGSTHARTHLPPTTNLMNYPFRLLFPFLLALLAQSPAAAQCIQQADGTWTCQTAPSQQPAAKPTAMDVRIDCPSARGSGTSVARAKDGGTLILTNYHVVEDQSRITVHSKCGSATATLIAHDAKNDLAVLSIRPRWDHVRIGGEVAVGTPVQFRAFDRGVEFRKYFGNVVVEYRGYDGTRGWFASGESTAGNSGGGVYSHGRLVGVLWGNPQGGTAFVPIGPVRALLERVLNPRRTEPNPPNTPAPNTPQPQPTNAPPTGSPRTSPVNENSKPEGSGSSRDAYEQRLKEIERQLAEFDHTDHARTPPHRSIDWLGVAAAALGVSTPLSVAILVAGFVVRTRRPSNPRGQRGPRDQPFPQTNDGRAPE